MTKTRKVAMYWFGGAFASALIAFVALFIGNVNHALAGGVMLLGFAGFYLAFNRGYDLWVGKTALPKRRVRR